MGSESAALSGPITQEAGSLTQDVKTSLVDESGNKVGTFEGTLRLTELGYDAAEETFTSTGLYGTVKSQSTTQQVMQAFEDTPTQLQANGGCTILHARAGCPLNLEVLGLRVRLNRLNLRITGETGSGNLLGNLLCAIADIGSGGGLGGILQDLLDVVNDLLSGLSA